MMMIYLLPNGSYRLSEAVLSVLPSFEWSANAQIRHRHALYELYAKWVKGTWLYIYIRIEDKKVLEWGYFKQLKGGFKGTDIAVGGKCGLLKYM